jgi:hypothetical protein
MKRLLVPFAAEPKTTRFNLIPDDCNSVMSRLEAGSAGIVATSTPHNFRINYGNTLIVAGRRTPEGKAWVK